MKFSTKSAAEKKNNQKQRITASIGNPLKMLKMFTKDLYKFPVQTAIQEYINNAKDAHLMVGKDTSDIEITGPTVANQTVIIKDYGPGLSPEEMKNVFGSITTSNKDKSDLFNGGFGIGSKSWFSINQIFSVVSTYNGMKRYYSILFTDNIYIDLDMEEETSEPNGVEVHLPLVHVSMIKDAQRAIQRATKYWRVKPKYINCNFDEKLDILHQEKDFTLYTSREEIDQLEVTLGETIYSVKDFSKYKKWLSKIDSPIAIHFDVGEVKLSNGQEVGPDRENFVQEMESFIDKKIKKALDQVPKIMEKYLQSLNKPQKVLEFLKYSSYCKKLPNQVINYKDFKLEISPTIPNYRLVEFKKIIRRPNNGLDDISYLDINIVNSSWNSDHFIILDDLDSVKAKQKEKLIKSELRKRNKNYGALIDSLSFLQEKTLKSWGIDFCYLSQIEYEEELEVFDLEKEVYVTHIHPAMFGENNSIHHKSLALRRTKQKIRNLDKDIPVVSYSSYKEIKNFGFNFPNLGIDFYETPNKNVKPLLAIGFKELSLSDIKQKIKEYKHKIREKKIREKERQKALEKKRKEEEALMAEKLKEMAKNPEIENMMALCSLYDFIKKEVGSKKTVNGWIKEVRSIKTSNSLIKDIKLVSFPSNFNHRRLEFQEIRDFPQDKKILNKLKELKKEYPICYEVLFKSINSKRKRKELEIILNNID